MTGFLILSALVSVAVAAPSVLQASPLSNLQAHASASASVSSLPQQLSILRLLPNGALSSDGRVLDSLELSLAKAENQRQRIQANLANDQLLAASSSISSSAAPHLQSDRRVLDAAERNEQLRLASQTVQSAQQQEIRGASPLLSATRIAQSLASLSPTGAASSSSVQLLDWPSSQQQLRQNLFLARGNARPLSLQANGLPLIIDGQILAL